MLPRNRVGSPGCPSFGDMRCGFLDRFCMSVAGTMSGLFANVFPRSHLWIMFVSTRRWCRMFAHVLTGCSYLSRTIWHVHNLLWNTSLHIYDKNCTWVGIYIYIYWNWREMRTNACRSCNEMHTNACRSFSNMGAHVKNTVGCMQVNVGTVMKCMHLYVGMQIKFM